MPDFADIKSIRNFKSLVRYLRTHLDWPIDEDDADDLTFEYEPDELGLDEQAAVKIREIKQIRPLVDGQPWGVFWIDFEPNRLPVVVMRRILAALVRTKRGKKSSKQAMWDLGDLMFISATGEGHSRGISFAHFHQIADGQPQLRTFSWDVNERHFYYLEKLNLEALRWPEDSGEIDAWREQWDAAFPTGHRETISTAQELAWRMADLAAATRELVNQVYEYERADGALHRLHDSFKRVLIHDLSVDDFADMYAQTVTYGLFSARATRTNQFALDAEHVVAMIPNTNPFLRDLFAECLRIGTRGRKHQIDLDELGVDELVQALSQADMEAILRDFGRQSKERKEDPVIHFYESFLKEYDPEKKARRGVFYTPDPVVSFIVRSVDYLLRTEFDCPDGLADTGTTKWKGQTVPKVLVLDPATGTATFLKHIIELIYETFTRNAIKQKLGPLEIYKAWNEYVPKHLLPRLYGFELMMAPYAVAHMKLGLALIETGYNFESDERLRVYLTNALQPAHEVPRVETPFLAHEAEEANTVKTETPITVMVGNPPYSVSSANSGDWIVSILEDYKRTVRTEETQIQAVSDDYVKFIRFAHWRIKETGKGIIGFITNNGYLRGPLFRDMRKALMNDFSQIYVLNLHGSTRWKEKTPEGSDDENVFDIQQGVAIILLVCGGKSNANTKVLYADLWGTREAKYSVLSSGDISTQQWQFIEPIEPLYIFSPVDRVGADEYNLGWLVTEVFGAGNPKADQHVAYGAGFATQQDDFAISFSPAEVAEKISVLCDRRLTEDDVRQRFRLCTTNQWNFEKARRNLRDGKWKSSVTQVTYRPFDTRYTAYIQDVVSIPRWAIMRPLLQEDKNVALITARIINGETPRHEYVSRLPIEKICLSAKTSNNAFVFPLYLYPDNDVVQLTLATDAQSRGHPNLSPKFIADLEARLGAQFAPHPNPSPPGRGARGEGFTPEDVFHYMYAVFHSPTYRTRYAEFLKIDFPRLPLTRNLGLFRALAGLGAELVALHLMESPQLDKPITQFTGKGDSVVASGYPKYDDATVWINNTQGFAGVPQDVWEFHIGGYQVCHKWLKDRRGRELSKEDKTHYAKIVVALQETIRLMEEIDAAIPGWPME